jgi:hypothetical protein
MIDNKTDISKSGDEAPEAFAELAAALLEIEEGYITPERGMTTSAERSAGRYLLANALQHGFQCWFDADPMRPIFQRWLGMNKKLLGDNPDAVYYGAIVDPSQTYRIRGNVVGACYTSFSVESGAEEGKMSSGVVATRYDAEFDVREDGSYEIYASLECPQGVSENNWLKLDPAGACSLTTRHYWEWTHNVAADPTFHVPLVIEPLGNPGPAPVMDDAAIAAGIRRVINFTKGATVDFPDFPPEMMPAWVSNTINQFDNSDYTESNAEIGFAAVDNAYLQARYDIGPDQALIMRGSGWPRCTFANVVLWNHRLQTPPYRYRNVSLNRNQVKCNDDGSFEIVIAHSDPGVDNWLDAAGQTTGMIFWRFLLPLEAPSAIVAELVDVGAIGK